MGKPLTIQPEDDRRLNILKKPLGVKTKVDVLRRGLDLLEDEILRKERIRRWKKVARLVAGQSKKINREFQKHTRLKKI